MGKGSQECRYNSHLPCAISTDTGIIKGIFKTPCVPDSDLPALLGLQSLRECRAIIDTVNLKCYFLGPGDFDLSTAMPPGTKCIQCIPAASGHMMMPVDCFEQLDVEEKNGGLELTEMSLTVIKAEALPS